MKMFWKVLGAAALAVGLTPYRVNTNEETGEKTYRALLWQATKTPQEGEKDALSINIGLNLPQEDDEAHLFSDELCVEYNGTPVTADSAPEAPVEAEESAEPAAEEAPAEPAEPEEAPTETPAEEEQEEA